MILILMKDAFKMQCKITAKYENLRRETKIVVEFSFTRNPSKKPS